MSNKPKDTEAIDAASSAKLLPQRDTLLRMRNL